MINARVMEEKLRELALDLRLRAAIEREAAWDKIIDGEAQGSLMASEAYEASAAAVDDIITEIISNYGGES